MPNKTDVQIQTGYAHARCINNPLLSIRSGGGASSVLAKHEICHLPSEVGVTISCTNRLEVANYLAGNELT